ncbi:beta strand repeat-containing protein [Serratia ureilytica]|uniref:beta strand repeat-containing protein n=1 Tax=Serratia ureilytica TaxID=300181 RepID=UPI003FA6EDF1
MASLAVQTNVVAMYYAILGQKPSEAFFDIQGQNIQYGLQTTSDFVNSVLTSTDGQALYAGKSDSDILTAVYTKAYGVAPTAAVLSGYLTNGDTLAQNIASLTINLITYNGFDSTLLSQQQAFQQILNTALYAGDGAATGLGGTTVKGIAYIMGTYPTDAILQSIGTGINGGTATEIDAATALLQLRPGLVTATATNFVKSIFKAGYLRDPTTTELNTYLNELTSGASRAQVIVNVYDTLKAITSGSDLAAKQKLVLSSPSYNDGYLPANMTNKEQLASLYLSVFDRQIDALGLSSYTRQLERGAKNYDGIIKEFLVSREFGIHFPKGITLSDYIQLIYTDVHGVAGTAAQLAPYIALGTDKTAITLAIINDLRNSTATDVTTVTQQHGFEFDIGTSLLYKTAASLTATAAGGNATGSVNTGASHQISNAETAVLTDVQLNANAASLVNLKFADHLANLTINGTSAATVNLSDNGVNPGVAVTVNNGNVILNASSGSDNVVVTSTANIATGTAQFNLGAGNDSLHWAGNAVSGGANTVANTVKADGGTGTDSISANFITKTVVTNQNALGVRTSTVTSNANNFSNFEKIDLTGYIGKSVGTLITTPLIGSPTTTTVTTPTNTFDFGLTNGTSTVEGTTGGTVTQNAAATNLGTQGFVISGLANVNVINAAGGTAAQLEVKGDATSASTLNFTFVQNATDHFNINFDAVSSANVNAGAISLNSSSSALLGTALTTVNVASGGTGSFNNILSLAGTNAQVQTVNVTGDHALNLTVGAGYSNVRDINASTNTGGLNLDSSHAGTGDGIIVQLLKALPLSAATTALLTPLLNTLGLNGYQLTVEGTSTTDSFNVLGNTTLTGGNGANTYDLKSSNSQAGVTITDFSTAKDKIVDAASGLTLSNTGTAVSDYGTRAADTLDALLGSLVGGLTTGVVGLLGGILGLSNPNSLTGKVGVASVVFSGTGNNADSYVIIDNNNNHTLDANDTVIYLTGQNHQQLVDTLHYA